MGTQRNRTLLCVFRCGHVIMKHQERNAAGCIGQMINYYVSENLAVCVGMSHIQHARSQWPTNVGLHQLHFIYITM